MRRIRIAAILVLTLSFQFATNPALSSQSTRDQSTETVNKTAPESCAASLIDETKKAVKELLTEEAQLFKWSSRLKQRLLDFVDAPEAYSLFQSQYYSILFPGVPTSEVGPKVISQKILELFRAQLQKEHDEIQKMPRLSRIARAGAGLTWSAAGKIGNVFLFGLGMSFVSSLFAPVTQRVTADFGSWVFRVYPTLRPEAAAPVEQGNNPETARYNRLNLQLWAEANARIPLNQREGRSIYYEAFSLDALLSAQAENLHNRRFSVRSTQEGALWRRQVQHTISAFRALPHIFPDVYATDQARSTLLPYQEELVRVLESDL